MISREDLVEQSVTDYLKAALLERGYPASLVEVVEEWPLEIDDTADLDKTYVGAGFNFDNAGESAELGSDLMVRTYSLEFFVFGTTRAFGKNVANVIKFAAQRDQAIPLLDYEQPSKPQIDSMEVLGATADRQVVPEPKPWQKWVWLTTVNVEDVYHAAAV